LRSPSESEFPKAAWPHLAVGGVRHGTECGTESMVPGTESSKLRMHEPPKAQCFLNCKPLQSKRLRPAVIDQLRAVCWPTAPKVNGSSPFECIEKSLCFPEKSETTGFFCFWRVYSQNVLTSFLQARFGARFEALLLFPGSTFAARFRIMADIFSTASSAAP